MSERPKYVGLPGISTEPDVFETADVAHEEV